MGSEITMVKGAVPSAPSLNNVKLFFDLSDNHLKTIDENGTVLDITDTALVLASQTEVKSNTSLKGLSPFEMFRWSAFAPFQVKNAITGLGQTVAPGVSYNLLTNMLQANESFTSNTGTLPTFYTIDPVFNPNANDGTVKTNWLDEINNKLVFPSNKNSFGDGTFLNYVPYLFHITLKVDIPSTSNVTTKFFVRLRRAVAETTVSAKPFSQSDFAAETGIEATFEFKTFVGSSTLSNAELDPYVLNGMYIDVLNSSSSATSVTIQDADIRIFRL